MTAASRVRFFVAWVASLGLLAGAGTTTFGLGSLEPGAPPLLLVPWAGLIAFGVLLIWMSVRVFLDTLWSVEITERGIARRLGSLRVAVPWGPDLVVDRTPLGFVRIRSEGRAVTISPTYPDADRIERTARRIADPQASRPQWGLPRAVPPLLVVLAVLLVALAAGPTLGTMGPMLALALGGIAVLGTFWIRGGARTLRIVREELIVRDGIRAHILPVDELHGFLESGFTVTLIPRSGPVVSAMPAPPWFLLAYYRLGRTLEDYCGLRRLRAGDVKALRPDLRMRRR